jgi:D-beta-D-heptose 7-phosphate kinase/D-beta-D-heptose 1-phosphate adenosyltransferase
MLATLARLVNTDGTPGNSMASASMNFEGFTVLCVGDIMLDRYVHAEIARISPEAPVPVMRLIRTREMLGGAGNCAHNLATLGGRCALVGLVAEDGPGETVRRLTRGITGIQPNFVSTTLRPTTCKTRFIAAHQQVVRADEESQLPLQPAEEDALISAVDMQLGQAQALLLSDYGKGVLSPKLVAHVIRAARGRGIPVFVDPKTDDFSRYRSATCITPNLNELARASKMPVEDERAVVIAARRVMADAECDAILVTRSERGMILVESNGSYHSLPALARELFDVSGAGDTVIAAMALAHASGMTLTEAMRVANAAAGVVVSKAGTATVTVDEVLHELEDQDEEEVGHIPGLVSISRAAALVARWKQRGLKVGFTNGCFDILHPGHVALLKEARGECNRLVVALNTDASIRRLKGPTRPINSLKTRAQVIAAIRYVDCVVDFDAATPIELIREFSPDVLIKGSDYTLEGVVGADLVQAAGGRVFLAQLLPGESTTDIIKRAGARMSEPTEPT